MKQYFSHLTKAALLMAGLISATPTVMAQQRESMYGDEVKFDVRMKYVYTMEDAIVQSQKTKKPIFMNCFADWAVPCHGMNREVFSNQDFADWMDKHFVCLFMDMHTEAGKALAEQYDVKQYAQYLVLNAAGKVILRIYGGSPLPAFQNKVALALNEKTTQAGATKAYQSGKRDKTTLLNYLNILELTQQYKEYLTVDSLYVPMLKEKEYTRAENWVPLTRMIMRPEGKYYNYLVEHKADFVKTVGEQQVNRTLERLFGDIYSYAKGDEEYNPTTMLNYFREMTRCEIPENSVIRHLYQVAKLRGEKQTDALYDYLIEHRNDLTRYALFLDMSLTKGELDDEQKQSVIAYLKRAKEAEQNKKYKDRIQESIDLLSVVSGIDFIHDKTFDDVLALAKQNGKPIFMDCYTTWCGPCKSLATKVFPQEEVGKFFNKHFVSLKMDMETPEGRKLFERYKVEAYPTLLFIDTDGNVIHRITGYHSATKLIEEAKKAVK